MTNIPNRFIIALVKLIQNARVDGGLTQRKLSWRAYIPQSTLSKMENGKAEPSASEIVYFAGALSKPIMYFFPNQLIRHLQIEDEPDNLNSELLLVAKHLSDNDLERFIKQMRSIVDFNEN